MVMFNRDVLFHSLLFGFLSTVAKEYKKDSKKVFLVDVLPQQKHVLFINGNMFFRLKRVVSEEGERPRQRPAQEPEQFIIGKRFRPMSSQQHLKGVR